MFLISRSRDPEAADGAWGRANPILAPTSAPIALDARQLDQHAILVHAFTESLVALAGVCDPIHERNRGHDIEIGPSPSACLVWL